jgi:hypothetical protein
VKDLRGKWTASVKAARGAAGDSSVVLETRISIILDPAAVKEGGL